MKSHGALIALLALLPVSVFAADDVLPASSEDLKAFDQAVGAARAEQHGEAKEALKSAASREARESRERKATSEAQKSDKTSREFVREQRQREEMRNEVNAMRTDSGRLQRDSIRDQIAGSGKSDSTHGGGGGTSGDGGSGSGSDGGSGGGGGPGPH